MIKLAAQAVVGRARDGGVTVRCAVLSVSSSCQEHRAIQENRSKIVLLVLCTLKPS